jgi:hypothetical protein
MEAMAEEAWREAQKIIRAKKSRERFAKYENDPVGFCEEILGDKFIPSIVKVMESVRDNPVTVARSATDIGKSHAAARVAIWFYLTFPESQVYITAAPPLDNLKRILWGEVMTVVRKHPELFQYDRIKTLNIARAPLEFMSGVAIPTSGTPEEREAKFSGKHAPHQLFIVDEGDAVPEEVYRGIDGCMSSGHSRLLVMFNPRAQVGPIYQMEATGQAKVVQLNAFEHPNVITGKDIIPGAVSQNTTLRRINMWTRPLVEGEKIDTECFEVPEFLIGRTSIALDGRVYPALDAGWRKIEEASFSYMVLGEFPSQSERQLINQAWIDAARQRHDEYVRKYGDRPPAGVKPIMGVDIAEFGGDFNVICLRYGGYIPRVIQWKGLDVDYSSIRALQVYNETDTDIAMIDATGPGAGVAPAMSRRGRKDDVRAIGVKASERPSTLIKTEIGEFSMLRDQMWWAVREWLRTDPNAMLPNDFMLIEELKTPTYTVKENGKIKVMSKDIMRDFLRRSPDRADALCLTFAPFTRAKVIRLVN